MMESTYELYFGFSIFLSLQKHDINNSFLCVLLGNKFKIIFNIIQLESFILKDV